MRGKDDSGSKLRIPARTLALALLVASCGDASCPGTSGDDGGRPPTCPSCGDACTDRYDGFHDVAPEPACPTVADEICNARDDDCDGRTDEGLWCVDRAGPYYPPAGAPNALGGLWVGGADDVWALGGPVGYVEPGRNQRAMRWDGTAWSTFDLGAAYYVNDLWGAASNDLVAVGEAGAIYRWDGTRWSFFESGTTSELFKAWGASPTDLWVLDYNGDARRWDGAAWSDISCPARRFVLAGLPDGAGGNWLLTSSGLLRWRAGDWNEEIRRSYESGILFGSGPDDVWLLAQPASYGETEAWRWDGRTWTQADAGDLAENMHAGWAGSTDDAWAADYFHQFWRWEGSDWEGVDAPGGLCAFPTMSSAPGGEPWLACNYAAFDRELAAGMFRWNGTYWQNMLGVDSVDFEAVAGVGGRIWAAGRAMSGCAGAPGLFERVDHRWVPVAGSVGLDLRDLWAAAENDVWAVGDGTARHFDGTEWTAATLPEPVLLLGVHGVAPDDVWAVGQATTTRVGAAARFDGAAWTVQRIGPAGLLLRDVFAVAADDVWAVGSSGADETADGHVWHWDGAAWSETAAPATAPMTGVWGVAADDVWAVGWSAQVLHWNGSAWSAGDDGGRCTFNDVWAAGPADVWAVGDAGCIAHRDRAGWRVLPPVHEWTQLRAVWGASAAQVFAVGYDGTVLLREP